MQQNSEGKEKKWKGKKRSDNNLEVAAGEGSAGNKGGRYSPCKHCGKQNHPHFRCWRRPDVRCRRCQKMGHIEKFCKEKGDQQQGEAHAAVQQEVDQLFVASCFISNTPCDSWLVDSGCTNHMTSDEKLFRNLDKSIKSRVRIGNGEHLAVEGQGTVTIKSCAGIKLVYDVMYVPEIDQNLLSVEQLVEKGFKVTFEEGKCLIFDSGGQKLFKIEMQQKSFSLNPLENEQVAFKCQVNDSKIWHKRLGHFHHKGLQFLQRNDMVRGLPNLEEKFSTCNACLMGKQVRFPFKESTWRATEKLQPIHSDLCGPQATPSLNGSRYFIIFIDEYTRMCWIYFMKQKLEVAEVFLKFKR